MVEGTFRKGQPRHRQSFSFERPQRLAHFAQEADTLLIVYLDGFIQQAEAVTVVARDRAKRQQVFRKAGASVADTGEQEAAADTGITANAVAHLLNVRPYGLADCSNRVDERDFPAQEHVGSVFDQLPPFSPPAPHIPL